MSEYKSKYQDLIETFKVYEKILHPDFYFPMVKLMAEFCEEVKNEKISDYFTDEHLAILEKVKSYLEFKKDNHPMAKMKLKYLIEELTKKD